LPADAATIEAFDWLADEVVEAGGEAWTWRAQPGSKRQRAALEERLSGAVVEEYRALIADAKETPADAPRRVADRLRRELHNIAERDRFDVKEREQARRAVARVEAALDAAEQETAR
jgi:hypothetical protein